MESTKTLAEKYGLQPTVKHRFRVTVEIDPENPKAVTLTQIQDRLADAPLWMDGVLRIEAYYRGTVDNFDEEDRPDDPST